MSGFRLKAIKYNGKTFPIVMQNENGPCPLLAVVNVLLCRGKINIHTDYSYVASEELYTLLGDYLMKSCSESMPKDTQLRANHEQNVSDAITILPQLMIGLDVNLKFRTVTDFEFTSQCIIFDLLEINLVHGWLMDNKDAWTPHIGNLSYNQIVEKVITYKSDTNQQDSKNNTEGFMADQFLTQTASQLTNYGIEMLRKTLKEDELCVFFRNNHFSTMLKHKGDLYLLATDLGYTHESYVVWEKLDRIDGDSIFVDHEFNVYDYATAKDKPPIDFTPEPPKPAHDVDLDFALAMQLHEEELAAQKKRQQPQEQQQQPKHPKQQRQLTEEEQVQQVVQQFQRTQGQGGQGSQGGQNQGPNACFTS